MSGLVRFVQHISLMISRLALGLVLIAHAWHRYHRVGISHETSYLAAHHVPSPEVVAWGSTILEALGGLALIIGLATPIVALAVVVQQILIIVWIKWRNGVYVGEGGIEYNVVLAAFALLFFGFGAGHTGLDAIFRRRSRQPAARDGVPTA